jgi:hypothetical protein
MSNIDRRQFIMVAGRSIPITIGVPYLVACSTDAEPMTGPSDPDNDPTNDPNNSNSVVTAVSTVDAGHSHNASIPESDVASTQGKSYGASSASGHVHTVTFTAADFETLRTTGQVTILSSSDAGHTHSFTFNT